MRLWMRWGALAFGVGLGLVPSTSRAEEPQPERRTLVLVQPVAGLLGQIGAGVEHALSEHVALALTAQVNGLLDKSGFTPTYDITTRRLGAGLEPGVHYYLAGRAPEGFWVGAHLEASVFNLHSIDEQIFPEGTRTIRGGWRTLEYGGSARAGYTAILAPGFSLQAGLGLAVLARQTTTYSSQTPTNEEGPTGSTTKGWGVVPRTTVGFGWVF